MRHLRGGVRARPGHRPHVQLPGEPLRCRRGGQELALFSISAAVDTATDVTVEELAIEAFYPADAATAQILRSLG